jgi:TRAP-type C4-dicarboxylate transport system permease small subunit
VLDTVLCALIFALMIVLAFYGYRLTLRTMTQLAPATGVTMGYIYMALPISAALIALYSFVDVFRNLIALARDDLSRAAIQPNAGMAEAALKEDGA